MFVCFCFCFYTHKVVDDCPKVWKAEGKFCYFLKTGHPVPYKQASEECKKMHGAALASINSQDELEFIKKGKFTCV